MSQFSPFLSLFVHRRSDFALQRADGSYRRVGRVLTVGDLLAHLDGSQTIGSYLIDERGTCRYAVFDADTEEGLYALLTLQQQLARVGIVAYLERSRRGGHVWVFLAVPALASLVRAWLLPFCPVGVEFYPKQNEGKGYGSLIRLPFGVHQKSGKRYPFVTETPDGLRPVASSLHASLSWLATVERVAVPDPATIVYPCAQRVQATHAKQSFSSSSDAPVAQNCDISAAQNCGTHSANNVATMTIRDWCATQDPYTFIGRYVDLSPQGTGCCPFSWHHANGTDRHASFKVYTPGVSGGYCWYCHVWQQGGSVFDFLRHYHHLDARTLWQQLRRKEVQV